MSKPSKLKYLKNDVPASIVVFFVALPLCLGIALASGAPLFSGLISGIIGGIVVGVLSGSPVGVSGPAASLAAIVLTAISTLGGYQNLLVAVVLGGLFQILFGLLKAGVVAYYFPSSVIKGLLTGIGIIIIIKQFPHFFGYDANPERDFAFFQMDGETHFSAIVNTINLISPGAALIGVVALLILILWDNVLSKKAKIFQLIQGPLVAVVLGVLYFVLTIGHPIWGIANEHLVQVPVLDNFAAARTLFISPNFAVLGNPQVWTTAFTLALVGSLATLLCAEAADKLDPYKRTTPTNRELLAQGVGNSLSGLLGGLPITQVIIRSSANVQAGGKTKSSAIIHGFLLLASVLFIPTLLNKIPLSVLAAILLMAGYKLATPSVFKKMYILGWKQAIPFTITVIGIVFTDLLIGIGLGLGVGIVVILINSYQNSHFLHIEDKSDGRQKIKMTLAEEVTFFNKGAIIKELDRLPENAYLELDVRKTQFLDNDIIEILEDFSSKAKSRNIDIKVLTKKGEVENPESYLKFFNLPSQS